jgi:hypothetical protein
VCDQPLLTENVVLDIRSLRYNDQQILNMPVIGHRASRRYRNVFERHELVEMKSSFSTDTINGVSAVSAKAKGACVKGNTTATHFNNGLSIVFPKRVGAGNF